MRYTVAGLVLLISYAAPAPASAYTLILRNGERVEIGNAYRLNGSRIEYVAGDTVLQLELVTVDLASTARANNDSVANFVARASRPVQSEQSSTSQDAASNSTLTITNSDLEPLRIERERMDAEYAARHPEAARAAEALPRASQYRQEVTPDDYGYDLQQWRNGFLALQDRSDGEQEQIDAISNSLAVRQDRPLKYGLSYEYNFGKAPIVNRGGQYFSLANPLYPYLRADEEFAQLNSRLIDLQIAHRATLLEKDRFLERARRAGVPPGFLRE